MQNIKKIIKSRWFQPLIAVLLVIGLIIFGVVQGNKMLAGVFAGAILGYILTRSRYGFAGGIKRIYIRGEGSLTKSLLILMAITSLVFMGIQWNAANHGAILHSKGVTNFIPGTQNVYHTNIATIVGGLIFGFGMMLAGGCGSGTLADFGEGEGRAFIAFIFFVLGALPGQLARNHLDKTPVGKFGFKIHLPQTFGYFGAFLITLALLAMLYVLTILYENKRKAENTYMDPLGDYEDFEKPLPKPENMNEPIKIFSYRTYHKLFVQRWSFIVGTVALALAAIYVMVSQQKAWGVSTPLVTLHAGVLNMFGVHSIETLESHYAILNQPGGLLKHYGTVRNIGLFFGCMIAFLLANRFKFNFKIKFKDGLLFALGGLMLGFGSRFALGCNIGAMYSSITNFSLSGWVFLIAMSLGGIAALKLFQGRICIIPSIRKDQLKQLKVKKISDIEEKGDNTNE